MIVGVGVDLISVRRMARALARRPGLRERLFHPDELSGDGAATEVRSLAARFAAKEAVRKAIGAGAKGMTWRDVAVLGGHGTPPRLALYGASERAARDLGATCWHVSLTHEHEYAVAMVVIER